MISCEQFAFTEYDQSAGITSLAGQPALMHTKTIRNVSELLPEQEKVPGRFFALFCWIRRKSTYCVLHYIAPSARILSNSSGSFFRTNKFLFRSGYPRLKSSVSAASFLFAIIITYPFKKASFFRKYINYVNFYVRYVNKFPVIFISHAYNMSYSRIKSMNTVSSGARRNRNTCSSFPKFCFSDTEAQIPFSIKIHKNLPGI